MPVVVNQLAGLRGSCSTCTARI